MSSRVVKSNSEMSTIAAIFDCYTIIRLQNNNTTWKTIPFMSKGNGLATINVEDAHIVKLDYKSIEIKDELKIKKTNLYTLTKPGLFLEVLTLLFKHVFSEFEVKKNSGPTTTDYFINKIVKRDFLLSKFFDDTMIDNDETSKIIWNSMKDINEHKILLITSLIINAKSDFIKCEQRELLEQCSLAVLRFIFFMTGFFSIKFEINWEAIKSDTLISTIKYLHYLNIINLDRNKSTLYEANKTLLYLINVTIDKDRIEREIRAKKALESKKSKAQVESSDIMLAITSTLTQTSEESEEEQTQTKRTSIFGKSTINTNKLTKLEMIKTNYVEPPSIDMITEFKYVPTDTSLLPSSSPSSSVISNDSKKLKKTIKSIKSSNENSKIKDSSKQEHTIDLGDEIPDEDIAFMLSVTQEIDKEEEESLQGEDHHVVDSGDESDD